METVPTHFLNLAPRGDLNRLQLRVAGPEAHDEFALPTPYWPVALGLRPCEQLRFLRALPEPEPLLCLLRLPEAKIPWLQATWEGLLSWSYLSAQHFIRRFDQDSDRLFGRSVPPAVLDRYTKSSGLPSETPLCDGPRHANPRGPSKAALRTGGSTDSRRSGRAVFEFTPRSRRQRREEVRSLIELSARSADCRGALRRATSTRCPAQSARLGTERCPQAFSRGLRSILVSW